MSRVPAGLASGIRGVAQAPITLAKRHIIHFIMEPASRLPIPNRAETLRVLRLMGDCEPILMLTGSDDGYGTRWTLGGQQVQPAIARYLMEAGFLAERGKTHFGARQLSLTIDGLHFRETGLRWWGGLTFLQKMWITVLG